MTHSQHDALDLRGFLEILRRRIGVLIVVMIVACGAAAGITALQAKKYTATASLLLTDPSTDAALVGTTPAQTSDPTRQAQTNLDVASLRTVAARTAARLGGGITVDDVVSAVKTDGNPDSNVLSIDATATTPDQAAALANGFAQEFIAFTRDTAAASLLSARQLLVAKIVDLKARGKRGPLLDALRTRANDLQVRASLQSGNGQVLQSATPPDSPSSPKPKRNLLIGAFAGLLMGIGAVLALEQFDRRLRRAEDVEESLQLPVIGEIARSRSVGGKRQLFSELPPQDVEAFRMIRANLRYYALGRRFHTLLITSATPGEGKSTVALYLAGAAAETGERVLLIEADLRRPSHAAALGWSRAHGLTNVLMGDLGVEQVVVRQPIAPGTNGSGTAPGFDMLLAGPPVPNPLQMIESEAMEDLLREVQDSYDLVIIDTPPAGAVSDALPLMSQVDGVVVVTRIGTKTRDAVHRLRDQLRNLNAPAVGVVANFADRSSTPYNYGHSRRKDKAPVAG